MDCISEGSNEILRARIEDTVRLCDKRGVPCFLGFLDLREQAEVRRMLSGVPDGSWRLFGGYDEAERAILAICPDYMDPAYAEYPLCAVAFRYRAIHKLTHRDFLGTLLSAGIRRDKIGDILCGEGLSVVFLREEIADFVCEQIERVGGEGVTIIRDYTGELPIARDYEHLRETVVSPRLDVIVKTLVRCSREKAAELIRLGSVSVDHLPIDSVSAVVSAPCTVSIRGSGRYLVDQIGPETKKGRLALLARKVL